MGAVDAIRTTFRNLGRAWRALRSRRRTPTQIVNLARAEVTARGSRLDHDPLFLSIAPTDRCNLHCSMCLTHSPDIEKNVYRHRKAPDMSFAVFKDILDRNPGAVTVNIIGTGEPALNPDLWRMIAYARDRHMTVSSMTNGVDLDRMIDRWLDSGVDLLSVSLNGHTADEFVRMTREPEVIWHRARENGARLVAERDRRGSDMVVATSHVVDRDNWRHIPDMIRVSDEMGADQCNFYMFLPSPNDGFRAHERCIFTDEGDIVDAIEAIEPPPSGMQVTLPKFVDRSKTEKGCDDYFRNLRVDGAGNVGGCPRMILDLQDNGRYDDPDVWNNAHFTDLRRRFADPDAPLLWPCQHCYNRTSRPATVKQDPRGPRARRGGDMNAPEPGHGEPAAAPTPAAGIEV